MRLRPLQEQLLVAAASLAATLLYFIEYLPPFKKVHLWSDIAGYSYPLHHYAFASLKQGRIPEWDPSIYCGISFAGNLNASLFYPPTWILYALAWRAPELPFKALEAFAFAHVWIAFVLAYLWLRGRTALMPSLLGGMAFACGGQMAYQLLHLGNLAAMAWMPLALWGIDESAQQRAWRPLWKVVVASALCFLAGYPACWIAFAVIAVVYAAAGEGRWRAAAGVAGALAVSVLLFLVQLLPAMEASSLVRLDPRYFPAQAGLGTLLLAHLVPNWFDFNPGHPTDFNPGTMYFYLGLPMLFGVIVGGARRQSLITLAAAFVLANPVLPLVRLVERWPALAGIMHPNEFYVGVSAMAALIAATGIDAFLHQRPKRALAPVAGVAAVVLLAARMLPKIAIWDVGGHFPTGWRSAVDVTTALLTFAFGMVAFRLATAKGRATIAFLLVLSAAVDYKVYGAGRWFNAVEGDEDRVHLAHGIGGVDDDAYRIMLANRQYRVATAEDAGPASTDYRFYRLATPAGFDPLIPMQYHEAIERWTPFRTNREFWIDLDQPGMLQTLGVRYVMARRGSPVEQKLASRRDFRLVGRADIFCPVYEYLLAKEPFFVEVGAAHAVGWTPERREFDITASGGKLVAIEQFHPGWRAFVDGHPAPIERWGGAFQSVALPPGAHHVTLEFHPESWRIGAWISALTALALLVWVRCSK